MIFPRSQLSKAFLAIFFLVCLSEAFTKPSPKALSPVIGILSTPYSPKKPESLIKTSYVEYIQSAGGRVVPIPWDIEEEKLETILNSVNGLLLPGGGAIFWEEDKKGHRKYSNFQRTINYIVNFVEEKNDAGVYFPLWAICQGLEAIAIAVTEDLDILDKYNHFGRNAALNFTAEATQSTMFQTLQQGSFDFLTENANLYFWHEYGLTPSVQNEYPELSRSEWTVTAYSKDDNGKEFIAAMESNEYPIFGVMFHGEKILFEASNSPKAKHPSGVVLAIKLMAKSLILEASKNNNEFDDKDLGESLLIENFTPVNRGAPGMFYVMYSDSLDDKMGGSWGFSSSSGGFTLFQKLLILAIVGFGVYYGYKKYYKKDRNPTFVKTDDYSLNLNEPLELKQKNSI